jgi:hypothetical protein
MAIPEAQLDTWSHQGSVTQSSNTYTTIKNVLEAADAPYADRSYQSFLQGSYGNDTNIWADSDVDVVMRLDSVFYYNLDALPDDEKVLYKAAHPAATYTYSDFKREVTGQLRKTFGDAVQPGNKAIFVEGNGSRRDVDVLVAAQYRKYTRYRSGNDQTYVEGITFWDAAGHQIINYPKLHSSNCTDKHKSSNQWYKPTVRILKNMRNRMIDDGELADGIAPSYFLEGMLYNVPTDSFGSSYQDTVASSINWLLKADRDALVCANRQYRLLHPTSRVTWRAEHFETYLNAVVRYWKAW